MFNLNSDEKIVIAFLSISILIGSLVHYYKIKSIGSNISIQNVIESQAYHNKIININTAEKEDLMLLEGVGPSLAGRIIVYRDKHGSFQTIEDIMNVKGIGPKKFDKIKNLIVCE